MHLRAQSVLQEVSINKDKLMAVQFLKTVRVIHINEDLELTNVNK